MSQKLINDIKQSLELLLKEKPEIRILIDDFESAIQALSYIDNEKEMRIKFPDIWKMQHSQCKDSVEVLKNQLIDSGKQNGVDIKSIFKEHENKRLSLDDFKGFD